MSRAVICVGDGARGSFVGGVLQILPFVPDVIMGVSSGALNAAFYAFGGPAEVERQWRDLDDLTKLYEPNGIKALWRPGLYNSGPIVKRIRDVMARSEFMRCPAFVSTTSLKSSEVHHWSCLGTFFPEAVAASATIPGLCHVAKPGLPDLPVDGALRCLVAVDLALNLGHDDVTIITGRPYRRTYIENWEPPKGRLPGIGYALRAVDIMLHEIAWNDIEVARSKIRKLTVYAPDEPLGMGLLEFDREKIMRAMDMGRQAKPREIAK